MSVGEREMWGAQKPCPSNNWIRHCLLLALKILNLSIAYKKDIQNRFSLSQKTKCCHILSKSYLITVQNNSLMNIFFDDFSTIFWCVKCSRMSPSCYQN